jgi:hypothetical protein
MACVTARYSVGVWGAVSSEDTISVHAFDAFADVTAGGSDEVASFQELSAVVRQLRTLLAVYGIASPKHMRAWEVNDGVVVKDIGVSARACAQFGGELFDAQRRLRLPLCITRLLFFLCDAATIWNADFNAHSRGDASLCTHGNAVSVTLTCDGVANTLMFPDPQARQSPRALHVASQLGAWLSRLKDNGGGAALARWCGETTGHIVLLERRARRSSSAPATMTSFNEPAILNLARFYGLRLGEA